MEMNSFIECGLEEVNDNLCGQGSSASHYVVLQRSPAASFEQRGIATAAIIDSRVLDTREMR